MALSDNSLENYGVESTDIKTTAGVTLSHTQKLLIGSVLDLFAGRPSLKKLSLWKSSAKFEDPLTNAEGRDQYAAQWYGLSAAFSNIERLEHQVISAGNPIVMDLKTRYVVKVIGKEQIIDSKVKIFTEGDEIAKVEDRWQDQLPEGAFKNVMRNLNSVVVPAFVSVPKSDEEEAAKKKA